MRNARPKRRVSWVRPAGIGLALLSTSVLALALAGPAFAGGWWRLSSRAAPSGLPPGGKATIILTASNAGDSAINATSHPVTVKDTLPPGLEATGIEGAPAFEELEEGHRMTCDLKALTCASAPETLPPFQVLDVTIQVTVKPGANTGDENTVSVSGGEQEGEPGKEPPETSLSQPITVDGRPTPFGVEQDGYRLTPEAEGGTLDTQAGSHPFQLTTTLNLNETTEPVREREPVAAAPALPKDLSFNLPPGLLGDPRAVPTCPGTDFQAVSIRDTNACSPQSAIGVAVVTLNEPAQFHNITRAVPLWNLEPAQGEPARFGFEVLKVPVVLDTSVRTGGDYGVTVTVSEAPEAAQILASEVTIWGAPGDAHHNQSRGWSCLNGGEWVEHKLPCEPSGQAQPEAFLTLPTSCIGPLKTTVEGQSWPVKTLGSEPGQVFALEGPFTEDILPAMHGCERVPFSPAIQLEPETHAASTPTGLKVDVHLPQQTTIEPSKEAEADVRTTTVTLPEGVQLNPASAGGLQACSEQQVGFDGPAEPDPLSPGAPQPLQFSTDRAHCPDASKIGTVHVRTPLLEHELTGAVYLATQNTNPFGSLLALYVVAEDPFSGVRVKLAGEVKLNGETGQITSTFRDTPQVPFEDFQLEFSGGPRASVATPPLCGEYATAASFTAWSGTAALEALSPAGEFNITSGPDGSPCANPQPFAPMFVAGSTSTQAGAFTPFTLQIVRPDGSQALKALTVRLPPGLAAMLSSVTPCPEPQASRGECGPESEIGQATASSGLGPDPYTITGGRVFITGPYAGAPFGLSIVTPAVAGPFNLGNVVVRSTINVDPSTAAVTISSVLPTIVQGVGMPSSGIPLQLQQVLVTVDRPSFEFNPTSCSPMRVEATITGSQSAVAHASSPFQVGNCQNLPFAPKLTASTNGLASRVNGTGLAVKITSAGFGQANIAKVFLQLPAALPSRLTTLQKACTDTVFNANPAACSPESIIGTATIHTPVLKSALSGPAYLVSHGNAAFPDVEFVLQGEGIILILDGKTDIKNGITYSRFETAPDAPFTTFETVLPAGPHSALTAYTPKTPFNLCASKLAMPTEITSQAGTIIRQNTSIAITGCKAVASYKATRAQLLAKALAACRKKYKHNHSRRAACERQARKRYPAPKKAHKTRSTLAASHR